MTYIKMLYDSNNNATCMPLQTEKTLYFALFFLKNEKSYIFADQKFR